MYPFKKFSLGEMKGVAKNEHKTLGVPFLYGLFGKRYAEWIQTLISANITPNFITIVGLISMQTSHFLTYFLDGKLDNCPRILPLLNAICMFIYITTDSVDGIHARATKQCSPIGKLLDHFIDANVVYYTGIALCSSLKTGISITFYLLIFCLINGFFVAEIVEKFTGCLVFGTISGACEGLYTVVFIHLVAFLFPSLIELTKIYNYQMNILLGFGTVFYMIYLYGDFLYGLWSNDKKVSFKSVFISLGQFILLLILFIPIYLSKLENPLFYFLTFGQCFFICFLEEYISIMTRTPASFTPFLFSYIILILQGFAMLVLKVQSISTLLQYVSTAHFIIRSTSVIFQLAARLGINLLKIRK